MSDEEMREFLKREIIDLRRQYNEHIALRNIKESWRVKGRIQEAERILRVITPCIIADGG